jgi:hypothetical protein
MGVFTFPLGKARIGFDQQLSHYSGAFWGKKIGRSICAFEAVRFAKSWFVGTIL